MISVVFAMGLGAFSTQANAACGSITVAEMNWASAEMLAHIDKVVLENGYGCEVELVPGSTMPTATSMMEKGEPDVAPELWINAVRIALDAATAEGRLHYAAEVFSDTGEEGWWIPQYIADANPDIQTVEDSLNRPDLFPHPEGDGAALYPCPSGWNCQLSTNNLFKAFGAEAKVFRLVHPGSGAGLSGAISKAYDQGEGWMGYYWAPTALMGKVDLVRLVEPPYDAACWGAMMDVVEDIKANGKDVYVPTCATEYKDMSLDKSVLTAWADTHPEETAFLEAYSIPTATVNKLLAYYEDEADGDMELLAMEYLQNNSEWKSWVSAEVAANVSDAL